MTAGNDKLIKGRLLRRYKRFLADVEIDGRLITAHCPNTGSMKNCVEQGAEVWLSRSDNPKRKCQYTWEYMRTGQGHYIGVNTGRANTLVAEAIDRAGVEELLDYSSLRREVAYGQERSRIDLLLESTPDRPDCFVEIKSVTLLEKPVNKGIGYFPDAISDRGAKHLRELMMVHKSGSRALLFFCVQHTAYKVRMARDGFRLWRPVPVVLP
jgi:sugar fermentation stimulation protein A